MIPEPAGPNLPEPRRRFSREAAEREAMRVCALTLRSQAAWLASLYPGNGTARELDATALILLGAVQDDPAAACCGTPR